MGNYIFDLQMSKRVGFFNQLKNLLARDPHSSLHITGELQTILRADERNPILVPVKRIQRITHIHHLTKRARPCIRLEAASDELVSHV